MVVGAERRVEGDGHRPIVDSRGDVADLEFLFLLLLGAAALVRGAAWLHVPYPIALVLVGLAAGAVPGLPNVVLEPEVVFLVFLPPLLASAGFYSSPRELRAELRPLTVLALGAVLATMGAVAVAAHELIDGLALGGRVRARRGRRADRPGGGAGDLQPHARARAGRHARRGRGDDQRRLRARGLPRRARRRGRGHVQRRRRRRWTSSSRRSRGVAIGLAAGWIEVRVLRKLDDRPLSILLSLLFPYAAYVAAEEAHVSGVLAAVVCGLYLGWFAHETFSADTRLSASAFWEVLVFGLNALLFLLLGLQFPAIVDDARAGDSFGTLLLTALALAAVVVLVRLRRRVPAVHAHGRRLARAAGDRLERHARRDLARGGAVGARDRHRPAGHRVRDRRRDPRDARRPGADAARAAARR